MNTVSKRVDIILVNWNGWRDTVRCLESLLELTYPCFRIIVCDNGSGDNSVSQIEYFLLQQFPGATWESLPETLLGAAREEIESAEYLRPQAGSTSARPLPAEVTLLRASSNLGFAGGNNLGIRFAFASKPPEFVWLLNNDTVVTPQALSAMVERMKTVPAAGMCGSTILYHDDPQRVQSLGGARYLKWAGVGVQLGADEGWPIEIRAESIEKEMSYVSGASMLVSRQFLESVGLMEESYFLYFEEIDWVQRAAGRFKLAYAPDSIVYHKEGGAIGSSRSGRHRSSQSFFWLTRSRLQFTAKYHPEAVPSVTLYSLINCMQWALLNGNPRIFLAGVKACEEAGRSAMRNWCAR